MKKTVFLHAQVFSALFLKIPYLHMCSHILVEKQDTKNPKFVSYEVKMNKISAINTKLSLMCYLVSANKTIENQICEV